MFRAVVTDPAGNSSTSNVIEVIVDNTDPIAGTLAFANLTDSGSSDSTPITQDGTFDLSLSGNSDPTAPASPMRFRSTAAPSPAPPASQSGLADGDYRVPRHGHRSGRQQLDQQRHRGHRRQHRSECAVDHVGDGRRASPVTGPVADGGSTNDTTPTIRVSLGHRRGRG